MLFALHCCCHGIQVLVPLSVWTAIAEQYLFSTLPNYLNAVNSELTALPDYAGAD
ncbi:hypothetical protein [Dendronalium sp. ChiSLP03b]|uniref:hypothetical protein n=1 Tax=Dendronalium sp. ChiSLP03b TaxID=3075381 RepID=UPI002AD8C5EE|nr:hypothetical protein [Dendronalium sp. ChiSLP03b]